MSDRVWSKFDFSGKSLFFLVLITLATLKSKKLSFSVFSLENSKPKLTEVPPSTWEFIPILLKL